MVAREMYGTDNDSCMFCYVMTLIAPLNVLDRLKAPLHYRYHDHLVGVVGRICEAVVE